MTLDLDTLIPLYALGALDEDEAAMIEQAIASEPSLLRELAALRAGLHALPGALAPIEPPPHLVERLLASAGGGPFDRFADRFGAMFDLVADRARELLGWIHDPARWMPATPGVALVHFPGGPAAAGADCGLVRVATGTSFPWHAHKGEEVSLFLAGAARDHLGTIHVPGGELMQALGSAHEFTSIGDVELIFAVRYRGVDFTVRKP